jgi:hypothetical protein
MEKPCIAGWDRMHECDAETRKRDESLCVRGTAVTAKATGLGTKVWEGRVPTFTCILTLRHLRRVKRLFGSGTPVDRPIDKPQIFKRLLNN